MAKQIKAAVIAPKRPRQYAAEIMKLKTIDERRAALANVPDPFKGLTKDHVNNELEKRKAIKTSRENFHYV